MPETALLRRPLRLDRAAQSSASGYLPLRRCSLDVCTVGVRIMQGDTTFTRIARILQIRRPESSERANRGFDGAVERQGSKPLLPAAHPASSPPTRANVTASVLEQGFRCGEPALRALQGASLPPTGAFPLNGQGGRGLITCSWNPCPRRRMPGDPAFLAGAPDRRTAPEVVLEPSRHCNEGLERKDLRRTAQAVARAGALPLGGRPASRVLANGEAGPKPHGVSRASGARTQPSHSTARRSSRHAAGRACNGRAASGGRAEESRPNTRHAQRCQGPYLIRGSGSRLQMAGPRVQ